MQIYLLWYLVEALQNGLISFAQLELLTFSVFYNRYGSTNDMWQTGILNKFLANSVTAMPR